MRRRAMLAALVLFVGCEPVLGVGNYRTAEPRRDAGTTPDSATDPPILPTLPDQAFTASCETCIRKNCGTQREKVLHSPAARSLLECTSQCDDPNCLSKCRATHDVSPAFDDYFDCAFQTSGFALTTSQCNTDCNAGANFACTGGYVWDSPPSRTSLKIEISSPFSPEGTSAYSGVEASACNVGNYNTVPTGEWGCSGTWTRLGAYGDALLSPIPGNSDSIALKDSDPSLQGNWQRIYPGPFPPAGTLRLQVIDRGTWSAIGSSALEVQVLPASRGIVVATQLDCLGVIAAVDTNVSISPPAGKRAYVLSSGATSPEYQSGSFYLFGPLAPNRSVQITSMNGDKPLSKEFVLIAAQWVTSVSLFPMDSRETHP